MNRLLIKVRPFLRAGGLPLHCFLCALVCFMFGCSDGAAPSVPASPQRMVSLAPNLTEIAFALGLDDQIVGTTTFCNYPPAARETAKVGNYANLNYEAMVALDPDLVLLLREYDEAKARLEGLGMAYLETGSYFVADILAAIQTIGEACGKAEEADVLVAQLQSRIDAVRRRVGASENHPRVLIVFSRQHPDEPLEQVYAMGPGCIHHELLEWAGGRNIVEGKRPFAMLSREAVIRLNPEIIIELAPDMGSTEGAVAAWSSFETVDAVKHGKITVLAGDYTCIPGPRFIQTLEDFAGIIGR